MAARIDRDGRSYRLRRGRLVEIPPEWVGKVTHPQTRAKRPSKRIHKLRRCQPRPETTTGIQR